MSDSTTPSGDQRIAKIDLDEETIIWRNADVEQERRIAIFDLIEENTFRPVRAAELLLERLEGKVETDFATARRLFTLICVLHIKG